MEAALRQVINAIVKYSRLDITLIRIGDVAEDSFRVSFEAHASNTGPVTAVLSAMEVDLCGPSGRCFGTMTLPELVTRPGGAHFVINDQLIRITDRPALRDFVGTVIARPGTELGLRDGRAFLTVPSLGIGRRPICYERQLPTAGMNGPKVSVSSAAVTSDDAISSRWGVVVTVNVKNPSPVELSFGVCELEIQTAQGAVIALLKGRLDIRRESVDIAFSGSADRRAAAAANVPGRGRQRLEVRFVGKRCAAAGWCDEAIREIDVPLAGADKVFRALGLEGQANDSRDEAKEKNREKSQTSSWHEKFWKGAAWI
ncbi:hypothetical protein GGS23DRAFT_595856 [Durotheca rogersii]|uniref:uncharacterized protein n=1 Tax=Durotheca rogersii TaxID=419775 RepID=UPI00221FFB89|nr:uncharacterized protein GGS23DRAFT_595856 [Durotheca rogersii]KAI5864219.1 hypothetical protein GGS23DRAFT_595856 [Durotheca rogersii]